MFLLKSCSCWFVQLSADPRPPPSGTLQNHSTALETLQESEKDWRPGERSEEMSFTAHLSCRLPENCW